MSTQPGLQLELFQVPPAKTSAGQDLLQTEGQVTLACFTKTAGMGTGLEATEQGNHRTQRYVTTDVQPTQVPPLMPFLSLTSTPRYSLVALGPYGGHQYNPPLSGTLVSFCLYWNLGSLEPW